MAEHETRPVVGILLFDEVEVLDFAGPYEVFSATTDANDVPYFRVVTLAAQPEVRCRGGLRVRVDATLGDCPPLDVLIVPGGPGADDKTPQQETAIIPFVQRQQGHVRILASVCTGAFVLARAGLLDGYQATTHSTMLDVFAAEFPRVQAVAAKVVDHEHIITAAGVSSGIDLALHIMERWFGAEARQRAAQGLDGPWQ